MHTHARTQMISQVSPNCPLSRALPNVLCDVIVCVCVCVCVCVYAHTDTHTHTHTNMTLQTHSLSLSLSLSLTHTHTHTHTHDVIYTYIYIYIYIYIGDRGSGDKIPPGATLRFDVELISWGPDGKEELWRESEGVRRRRKRRRRGFKSKSSEQGGRWARRENDKMA